ncbi:FAD-binding oxidoreductase [Chitinophaga horti]|uniref:FAD-binding oxidoreductase n=1 Tax=Chitinophaga horti TaxID=2920382 RepID=A0ABY6IVF3_9BACT|nr:FAD-dependent oxidoreductase [Chitinophaga horti]UYQ91353.1 FAD-binding oxidoreductase [Chitinophaga horti]
MILHSGLPYSLVRYGLPFNYPKLEQHIRTDVVIIGAGISGALTAYALTNAGIACTVVDARTVGLGSTCASTSLLQYEIDVPLHQLMDKVGVDHAVKAYHACRESIDEIEVIAKKLKVKEFERKQSLYFASATKDLSLIEKEFAAREKYGFDVEYWNAAAVKRNMGFEAPAAIYSHSAAYTDAYTLTHALLQYIIKQGAAVYDRTNVVEVQMNPRSVTLTTHNGKRIQAKKLVIATGYESVQYIKEKIVDLHATYAVLSETHTQTEFWHRNCLIWETKQPYRYMRSTYDNRLLIGGRDVDFYHPRKRDKLLPRKSRELVNDFHELFPKMEFLPEFEWTGTFGTTKDGLPYIGVYPPMKHALFALGFGGNGITFSQVAAKIVTDHILGKKNELADVFSFDRLQR